jgi:hypothetical protein
MSTHLPRWALLIGLAFAVPTLGPAIVRAQAADVSDAANFYPGRYAARCTPAPIFGCVCATDSSEEALMFTELDSKDDHHLKDVADSEYLRMISWLRRTCESLIQPATYRQPGKLRLGYAGIGRGQAHPAWRGAVARPCPLRFLTGVGACSRAIAFRMVADAA